MESVTYEQILEKMNAGKVNKVYIIAAIITALGGFLFGYDTAIISTTLIFVTPLFKLTTEQIAFLVAGESVLAAIGALVAGPLVDKYGRKILLIADGFMYFIFAILTAVAVNSFTLILWRTLIGFSIGADTAVATGYISEFSPTKVRGRLAISQQLMIFSGFTVAFWVGYLLSFSGNWRLMYGIGAIPAIILLLLRFYLPESPRWLLIQGKIEKGKASLKRFGVIVKESVQTPKKEKGFKELFSNKSVRKAILLVGFWMAFQQITGINIILYFGPTIYGYIGLSGPRAILNTAISETLGAFEYAVSFMLIDRWGRRRLGIIGYSGLVFSLVLMLVGIAYFNSHNITLAVVYIFSAMTLFLLFFHIGVGGVGWVLQGETLPTEFRGRGMGILAAVDWMANFIIIFLFPYWEASFGIFSFFVLELVLSIIAITFVAKYFPETKNIPLEKMPNLFERKLSDMRKPYRFEDEKGGPS